MRARPPSGLVAFLLTDIEGSTRLWQDHRPVMPAAITRHDEILRAGIDEHGGRVLTERGEGDSFFAVFARASDAVAAARDIQLALHAESWPNGIELRVRMAINTGEAAGDYRGPVANRSARIRLHARGGQILLSQSTYALVLHEAVSGVDFVDAGVRELRDVDQPEHVYEARITGLPPPPVEAPNAPARRRAPPVAIALPGVLAIALVALLVTVALTQRSTAGPTRPNRGTVWPGYHTAQYLAGRPMVTVAGTGTQGFASGINSALDAELDHPAGLAIGADGDVFIADTGNNLVRELLPNGTLLDVIGGGARQAVGGEQGTEIALNHPTGLFADPSGDLYISDTGDNRILRADPTFHVWPVAGNGIAGERGDAGPALAAELRAPTAAVHGPLAPQPDQEGKVPVGLQIIDTGNQLNRYTDDSDGSINKLGAIGSFNPASPPVHAQGLPSLALSRGQNVYGSDSASNQVFLGLFSCSPFCSYRVFAGTGTAGFTGDGGYATHCELNGPEGLALDRQDSVFIADTGNDVIRMVDSFSGKIWTVAGTAGLAGFAGEGRAAGRGQLDGPAAVAIDSKGDVFIADTLNNRIREIKV